MNSDATSKGSDQSVIMRRLVWANAGRTYQIVGNLMPWLIWTQIRQLKSSLIRVHNVCFLPVTTSAVCSSHLFTCLGMLYCEQYGPRSDCSLPWEQSDQGSYCLLPASHNFCRLLLSSVYVLRKPILQTIWTKIRLLPSLGAVWLWL